MVMVIRDIVEFFNNTTNTFSPFHTFSEVKTRIKPEIPDYGCDPKERNVTKSLHGAIRRLSCPKKI